MRQAPVRGGLGAGQRVTRPYVQGGAGERRGFQAPKSSKYPAMAVSRSRSAEANSAARRSMSDVIADSARSRSP
ncbi:hypothetical protein [Streptomyces sp. AC602_WCS936]|uniref:hypothetical protein n=1 Tax=Streptomyces sp. AC602_WCS936 TaxID=2823685 RepID=UPI001C278E0E|nr:hypothetical protein [Streptomyces sp. AC602_WCS936]